MHRGGIIVCYGLAVFIAGCGYKPGSFNGGFAGPAFHGQRHTVGCLDVSVSSHRDAEADGPVAAITVGNRCDAAVRVDLGAIRAEATTWDGVRIPLRAYDPGREIRPVTLEARRAGRETIEYQPAGEPILMVQLCLDLGRIDSGAPNPRPVVACVALEDRVASGEVAP